MFRCTECGEEYKNKPDFCDCGNDVFEEISSPIFEEEEKPRVKKSFEEMYPSLARFRESLDPISVVIFSLCIVLSILSLIFIGNNNGELETTNEIQEVKQTNIKDIDEIWDDTPVKIVQEKKVEAKDNKENAEIKIFVPKTAEIKTPEKTLNKNTNTQKAKTNPAPKTQTKSVQNAPKAKTATPTVSKPKTTSTAKNQTSADSSKTKSATSVAVTQKNVQLKPAISTQTNTQKTTAAQKEEALKELKIYKNSLRNLLFSKINFAQIEGDGIGIVSFKVENNGKLTNKTFVQRSNNVQLDDALFYSLNTTSSYKAPPSAYKGETLKFKVKFVGGQYEVSLN